MPSRPGRCLALAVAAIAAGSLLTLGCARIAIRPRGDWVLARTPRFEIVSGLSPARTRAIAEQLERFTDAAAAFTGLAAPARGVPTRVVLFPHTRNYAAARPRRDFSGYFQPAAHANFLVIDASEREASQQIVRHELVHLLQSADPRLPAWAREGVADLLSTAVAKKGGLEVGRAPEGHLKLARAAPLSLGRLLGAEDLRLWDRRSLHAFYAQSWALAHYLRLGAGAPPRDALNRYVDVFTASGDAGAACRAAFGRDIAQLERDVLRHVELDDLPTESMAAPKGRARVRVALTPLASADRDALLGDLALALGERHWRRAERWLRASLAAEPSHRLSSTTLAWLHALRGDPEAPAEIEAALARGGLGPEEQRRVAEAWLALAADPERREARPELLARAAAAFAGSLALDASQPAARFGAARVAAARGEARRAARALEALRDDLPALPAVGVELARSQLAAGRADDAQESLHRALASAHGAEQRPAAREDLASLLRKAGIDDVNSAAANPLAARIDVHTPPPGEVAISDVPWIELRGKAGLWDAAQQDIAIALDVSNSTLEASGLDVDGDGRVGRTLGKQLVAPNPERRSSDRGDSIARAEIAAAEQLVAELDPETTRVSLVLFTASARLAAPLGAPRDALAALRRQRVPYDPTGTSFAEALRLAFEHLIERRLPGRRSQRTILMLSDGEPTAPNRFQARSDALAVADELARYGVRVYAYALGENAAEKSETLREVAERSGGHFSIAAEVGDVSFLRDVRLTGLEGVSIRNERTGRDARAVRVFADGSFDAMVPLALGDNPLEIRAQVAGRPPLVARRRVQLVAPERDDAAHAARVRALREALELRTRELEARARAVSERAARVRRTLEIEARAEGGPPPVSAGP